MKTLTVKQPWAWLIVQGFKDVENRTWPAPIRGRVLIHASGTPDANIDRIRAIWNEEVPEHAMPENLPLGGIVGEVTLTDCITDSDSDWAEPGMHHWLLGNARPITFKSVRGRLGLWEFDESLL